MREECATGDVEVARGDRSGERGCVCVLLSLSFFFVERLGGVLSVLA